jgi:hypothetical protein
MDTTFHRDYQAAHDDGTLITLLCDANGLSWAGGKFSFVEGRPFYGLARYLLLALLVACSPGPADYPG